MTKNKVIKWNIKHFSEISVIEWHDMVQKRLEVFVVEQNCVYQDVDGKDKNAYHIYAKNSKGDIIAYARLLNKNCSYKEVSIGRVLVDKRYRKIGVGHELMNKTLYFSNRIFGQQAIRISAQEHLTKFYQNHGFEVVSSKAYLEDGIPHVEMLRKSISQ